MQKIRNPRDDDQENIQKAFDLIQELMSLNSGIEPSLWCSAMCSILAKQFLGCGYTFEEFNFYMKDAISAHKSWWKEKKNDY